MERIKFNKCLNREVKYYNWSVWAIIGGFTLGFLGLVVKGLFWGCGIGVVGFFTGQWLGKHWHLGNIQRIIYWKLPIGRLLIDKELPPSHERNLF